MRELWKLNPYIAKYPHLLLGGVVFIFFTNVFAVYAPSLIGEGVNAMKAVDEAFLAPLRASPPHAGSHPPIRLTFASLSRLTFREARECKARSRYLPCSPGGSAAR